MFVWQLQQSRNVELGNKVQTLEDQLKTIADRLREAHIRNDELEIKLVNQPSVEERQHLQKKIDSQETQMHVLAGKLKDMQSLNLELEEALASKVAHLTAALKQAQDYNHELEAAADMQTQHHMKESVEVTRLQAKHQQQRQQAERDFTEQYEKLESLLKKTKAQVRESDAELSAAHMEKSEAIRMLQATQIEADQLESELSEANSMVEKQERELQTLRSRFSRHSWDFALSASIEDAPHIAPGKIESRLIGRKSVDGLPSRAGLQYSQQNPAASAGDRWRAQTPSPAPSVPTGPTMRSSAQSLLSSPGNRREENVRMSHFTSSAGNLQLEGSERRLDTQWEPAVTFSMVSQPTKSRQGSLTAPGQTVFEKGLERRHDRGDSRRNRTDVSVGDKGSELGRDLPHQNMPARPRDDSVLLWRRGSEGGESTSDRAQVQPRRNVDDQRSNRDATASPPPRLNPSSVGSPMMSPGMSNSLAGVGLALVNAGHGAALSIVVRSCFHSLSFFMLIKLFVVQRRKRGSWEEERLNLGVITRE